MGYMDSGTWVIGEATPDSKIFQRKPSTFRSFAGLGSNFEPDSSRYRLVSALTGSWLCRALTTTTHDHRSKKVSASEPYGNRNVFGQPFRMQQSKETILRPILSFELELELELAGEAGCTVVSQSVRQSRLQNMPRLLNFEVFESYKER